MFRVALHASVAIALVTLAVLVLDVFLEGRPRLNGELVTKMPSSRPARAGIQSAIFGSLWCVGLAAIVSLPLGVGTALYLEEFAPRGRWYVRLVELNIQNLAGVPSVVFGILGLAFIARGPLSWGFTVGTGAMVLTILVLPTVVIASREAIRAVPSSLREGALALGATRWQAVWRQVLPAATPGIATGSILSVSRALGESAPPAVARRPDVRHLQPRRPRQRLHGAPAPHLPVRVRRQGRVPRRRRRGDRRPPDHAPAAQHHGDPAP
ncbi:MAG: phosphate ABC transporter permease PstA, partial [Acidimicrobiia bacterium]|nr:phosphate ABC transporter permease PstA [Acidimicrobiia bacterium]